MSSILDLLQIYDLRIITAIHQKYRCKMLDYLMNVITRLGSMTAVLLMPFLLLLSDRNSLEAAGRNLLIILVISQIIVHSLKWLISRPRPFSNPDACLSSHPSARGSSFPSGHSSASLAVALSLSHFVSMLTVPLLILAILVSFSRLYLGVHYLSDVLAGCLISSVVFLLCQAVIL